MTEDEKRNMLQSVLNGEQWEYRKKEYSVNLYIDGCPGTTADRYSDWLPYKLGDAIDDNCEYRPVCFTVCIGIDGDFLGKFRVMSNNDYMKIAPWWKKVFSGTKKECYDYIDKNTLYVTENVGKLVAVSKDKILKWYSNTDNDWVLFRGSEEACNDFIKNYKGWQVLEYKGDFKDSFDKYIYTKCNVPVKDNYQVVCKQLTEGACKEWVKEHSSWIDNNYPVREDYPFDDWDRGQYAQNVIHEFASEFFRRVKDYERWNDIIEKNLIDIDDVKSTLTDMGVNLSIDY